MVYIVFVYNLKLKLFHRVKKIFYHVNQLLWVIWFLCFIQLTSKQNIFICFLSWLQWSPIISNLSVNQWQSSNDKWKQLKNKTGVINDSLCQPKKQFCFGRLMGMDGHTDGCTDGQFVWITNGLNCGRHRGAIHRTAFIKANCKVDKLVQSCFLFFNRITTEICYLLFMRNMFNFPQIVIHIRQTILHKFENKSFERN